MAALSANYPNVHAALDALSKCLVDAGRFRHRGRGTLVRWICDWATSPNLSVQSSVLCGRMLPILTDTKSCAGLGHAATRCTNAIPAMLASQCGWQRGSEHDLQSAGICKEEEVQSSPLHESIMSPATDASCVPCGHPEALRDARGATRGCFAVRVLLLIVSQASKNDRVWWGLAPSSPCHLDFKKQEPVSLYQGACSVQLANVPTRRTLFAASGNASTAGAAQTSCTPGLQGNCGFLLRSETVPPQHMLQPDLLEWMMTSCALDPVVRISLHTCALKVCTSKPDLSHQNS